MSRQAHGLRAWLLQRFTAVYLAIYFIYFVGHFVYSPPQSYVEWRDWIADPLVNLATSLFVVSVLIHAWVGVRDIIMDYVGSTWPRVIFLGAVALTLTGTGVWALRILFISGGLGAS